MKKCIVCKKDVSPANEIKVYRGGSETDDVMHSACVDSDKYRECEYCGFGIVHPVKDLNDQSECPEHKGESDMDDEEREGWEDIIENMTKDG